MRFFAPLSAVFLLIIDFYPPLRQICLTAEKRLVSHLQHKPLSFFRKTFSLPTAPQFLRADRHEIYKQSNTASHGTVYCFSLKFCYNNIRNRRRFQYNSNGGT